MKREKVRILLLIGLVAITAQAACKRQIVKKPLEDQIAVAKISETYLSHSSATVTSLQLSSWSVTYLPLPAETKEKVYFDFDSAKIRPDERPTLLFILDMIEKYPKESVLVTGNCDSRGSYRYNRRLGMRRAGVVSALLHRWFPKLKIRVVSNGKERPVCSQQQEGCWQENRNATIEFK